MTPRFLIPWLHSVARVLFELASLLEKRAWKASRTIYRCRLYRTRGGKVLEVWDTLRKPNRRVPWRAVLLFAHEDDSFTRAQIVIFEYRGRRKLGGEKIMPSEWIVPLESLASNIITLRAVT